MAFSKRVVAAVVGMQQSGKTYFCDQLIKQRQKIGGLGIVYNLGRDTDFESCNFAEVMTLEEHKKYYGKDNKQIVYYKNKNENKKPFSSIIYDAKGLKFVQTEQAEEKQFFINIWRQVSNAVLIVDDCKTIFRHGLKQSHLNWFNRANHAGNKIVDKGWKNAGNDVYAVFHNLDEMPPFLWAYYTKVIQFRTNQEPFLNQLTNHEQRNEILKAQQVLKELPRFSRAETIENTNIEEPNPYETIYYPTNDEPFILE